MGYLKSAIVAKATGSENESRGDQRKKGSTLVRHQKVIGKQEEANEMKEMVRKALNKTPLKKEQIVVKQLVKFRNAGAADCYDGLNHVCKSLPSSAASF